MNKIEAFKKHYAEAINSTGIFDCNTPYQELGGNSLGIFVLTEAVKSDLAISIDPVVLLGKESSFNQLVDKYFMD